MANITRNFIAGRMNKTFDQRVVPDGEYIDAMNVRMGSTEKSEAGVIENTKGNVPLTTLSYNGDSLSTQARCIGAIDDSARETLYWFVHDPYFPSTTGKLDMIVSFNITTQILTYHVISTDDGGGVNTTLNFNPQYLITGNDIIENLLFWTDDYNPPRFININRNYAYPNALNIDNNGDPALFAESIQVIKKPPTESPSIELTTTISQENYLTDRFICFAYRYKYADGEYSATSQWSEPAFVPQSFDFSPESFLNEGMVNEHNAANIYYNSGGPLVVGIDLLFKGATSNVIKIIEKIDKKLAGLNDNTVYQYFFNNSKIFTILPESELLRLYDNVPRFAKAQTIMGNRMMYGNYVDGYDLIDKNGNPTLIDYTVGLNSEQINNSVLNTTTAPVLYTWDVPNTVADASLIIDFSGVDLIEGALVTFGVVLTHDSFTGSTPYPTATTSSVFLNFSIYLQNTYSSVYAFASSTEFQQAIGTSLPSGNIQLVYNPSGNNSCDGVTFTDIFNCELPSTLDTLIKYDSGVGIGGQAIGIITSPSSNNVRLVFLAMKYVDNPSSITKTVYEYYKIISSTASYSGLGVPRSLHSNRGYEVGIVYMDEFNRATPAFCSPINTAFVPCEYSKYANSITVTIPPTQVAPAWAKRYKFVCKADMAGYETIYSNIFFDDIDTNAVYFLLEGENARKVEVGDRLIVKADTLGPTTSCKYATVLEKEAKQKEFIITVDGSKPPAGVYMKINPNDFITVKDPDSYIKNGAGDKACDNEDEPYVECLMNIEGTDPLNPTWDYVDFDIPAGSIISLTIENVRERNGICNTEFSYKFDKKFISPVYYTNIYNWFEGQGIGATLISGCQSANCVPPPVSGQNYTVTYVSGFGPLPLYPTVPEGVVIGFNKDNVTNRLYLQVRGLFACLGSGGCSNLTVKLEVIRSGGLIIFETEPLDTLPDVFFENNLSFPIDADGNHLSNGFPGDISQDIATNTSAVIQTGFFNCFSFGNGAESYKIRDSIVGRDFNLGNRVTTVAAQDYKESRRFADITYSSIYNPETNVNKLNEFNNGLLNYKNLELSFGAIYRMDGRETDVLVLQEDKISYVLAGKNLLSDAAAGGAITSVPEVLGTQIARVEKYGISFNPESYVQWGYDRFFTDAKRGAVLQLRGNAYSNEQLTVVSDQNMRTFFRDTFNNSFNTQKLGGFDPYMNEYVLSVNDIKLPFTQECTPCGVQRTLTFTNGEGVTTDYESCISFDQTVGNVDVDWVITSIDPLSEIQIDVTYNGTTYSSGVTNVSGTFSFLKDLNVSGSADVLITVTGNVVFDLFVSCPVKVKMTMIGIALTNDSDAGQSIVLQYNYTSGTYTSALQSNLIILSSGPSNPLVSYYNSILGYEGFGGLPIEGATMTLQTNGSFPYTSFVFDPATDSFKYARTTTLYANNSVDMNALLSIASTATPIVNPSTGIYNTSFTVPPSIDGEYLYIIWDLRASTAVSLCYDTSIDTLCCDCII